MTNSGVKCNVSECVHNSCDNNLCELGRIEITHDKTNNPEVSAIPHFCKNYQIK